MVWEVCSLGSVWYITHMCGSYPALSYPRKRSFQPYTVLGTQDNYVPFHSLPFLYSITHPTTILLYHARSYPIYHSLSFRFQDTELSIFYLPLFRCPRGIPTPQSRPFICVALTSVILSSSPLNVLFDYQ